jgi:hydroxymethylpyrimidine pyrophosphatase-like HAD family hydrolase
VIRLIGIDVDGTLLDSRGHLPPANRDAIFTAVAAGIHVALVTGRSYPFARPVADTLPESITLIVSSGAVERSMDGTVLARRLLDRRIAASVLEATRPHRDHAALVFDRDEANQIVFETMDWTHPGRKGYWARNKGLIARSVPLEYAGTPVVMGNAVEPLKTRGFYETGSQDESGVAQAIHRLVLKNRT